MSDSNETRLESNIWLGTVEWQPLSQATVTHIVSASCFLVEGVFMVVGNALLICVILAYKQLRRKEMYIMAALAAGDLVYGTGYLFGGGRRLILAIKGMHLWKVTPWSCMLAIQTPFFIAGSQLAGFMLVALSVDRLVAIRWFDYYIGLGTGYAMAVIFIAAGYCFMTVPIAALLSAYATDQKPRVPALCISTHVGPDWMASYQPTIQMGCGILSVLIYIGTWYFYTKQIQSMPQSVQNQQMKKQQKLTRTVGITVLFTFFCYVLPHSMIFVMNTFQASKPLAAVVSPYGWVLSAGNSIVNIFILGVHNRDVRRILIAWFSCEKPQFDGGHAVPTQGPGHSHEPMHRTNEQTGSQMRNAWNRGNRSLKEDGEHLHVPVDG